MRHDVTRYGVIVRAALQDLKDPRGLPDWRDRSLYPKARVLSPAQWRWEFLRRAASYQEAWERCASNPCPITIRKECRRFYLNRLIEPRMSAHRVAVEDITFSGHVIETEVEQYACGIAIPYLPASFGRIPLSLYPREIASQVAKPDGLVVVDPAAELAFLHGLPVELMWGVGPVTKMRLADAGVLTIGQLAHVQPWRLEKLLGIALGQKLSALAWNRDPREIKTQRRSHSAGAQSALGRRPAEERIIRPTLLHLADRIASRLRAKSRPGRTVTARVRFADMRSVTRSVTLPAPISATGMLAEVAEAPVHAVLADHPQEKVISLLAISVSNLEEHPILQLELPIGLDDEACRPGSKRGRARWGADRAVDAVRDRFGWDAIGYGPVALGMPRLVPDDFRQIAEKNL